MKSIIKICLSIMIISTFITNNITSAVDTTSYASPTSVDIADGLPITETAYSRTETMLHTVVQFQVYHENVEEIVDQAFKYMEEMEALLSTNLKGSDVYNINQNAGIKPVVVKPQTFEIIKKAIQVAEESNGLFDISIGALTNLWQIGSPEARKPSDQEIQAAINKIDYQKIILDEENLSVFLEEEGMALELGGISKGYIGSGVANFFKANDITTAIINLGGNVVVMGSSPANNQGWNVGVQDPDKNRGEIVGAQRVKNAAVVTSGIYERVLEVDGEDYHHIMDPRSGYPLDNNVSAVTVFAPTSFEGDSYSTALFMLGIEEGLKFINSKEGFEVVYIDKDNGVYLSEGIKDSFELTNNLYHIAN